MIAARSAGNSATVGLLLSKRANPKLSDTRGVTALCEAAHAGDMESIRLLLASGADVNFFQKNRDSILMAAAEGCWLEAISLLLGKAAASMSLVLLTTSPGMDKSPW